MVAPFHLGGKVAAIIAHKYGEEQFPFLEFFPMVGVYPEFFFARWANVITKRAPRFGPIGGNYFFTAAIVTDDVSIDGEIGKAGRTRDDTDRNTGNGGKFISDP